MSELMLKKNVVAMQRRFYLWTVIYLFFTLPDPETDESIDGLPS